MELLPDDPSESQEKLPLTYPALRGRLLRYLNKRDFKLYKRGGQHVIVDAATGTVAKRGSILELAEEKGLVRPWEVYVD